MNFKIPVYLLALIAGYGVVGYLLRSSNLETPSVTSAAFSWFTYQGQDALFSNPLSEGSYQNPIMAGFYPDPSIVRVEDTYYMVHSSFAYFPGVPIFKSKNLVQWQSVGYVLDRPSQFSLGAIGTSRGIFAPTLRYNKGRFYLITTNVDGPQGNFLVTATDPSGDWSDPILLPEIQGIDPSMFFDDDGRVYITHNGEPEFGPLYDGHRAIWLWEFDPSSNRVIADSGRVIVNGGTNLQEKPIWVEGPHIFKRGSWYYLTCAQGGTAENHSQVIFRSTSIEQPFTAFKGNPILTQRDLPADRPNPVSATGHADFVQMPNGQWWAVFLATRPYDGEHYHIGRETYLLPVTWEQHWPVILPAGKAVPHQHPLPAAITIDPSLAANTGNFLWHDDFREEQLQWQWNFLRLPHPERYRTISGKGLELSASSIQLHDLQSPTFIGRRQQHHQFMAKTQLLPPAAGIRAGITVYQSERAYFFFYVERVDNTVYFTVDKRELSDLQTVASIPMTDIDPSALLDLEIHGKGAQFSFQAKISQSSEVRAFKVLTNVEGYFLSTQKAGGFVGNFIGLHVYSP